MEARVFRIASATASAQGTPTKLHCALRNALARWPQLVHGSCLTEQPVSVSGTLPCLIQHVDGAELFGLFMFLRIAHAPAQSVTDSSFVEQGVNQRGRKATEASPPARADLCRDVWCETDAWGGLGDTLSVRKVKARTTPEAGGFGASCPAERASGEALGQPASHTLGSLDCTRWFCETARLWPPAVTSAPGHERAHVCP